MTIQNKTPMRHVISLLIENESGALSRVSGLFSARGYNIESLTVAPTEDASLSRMTIVTTGSDEVIEQITFLLFIKRLDELEELRENELRTQNSDVLHLLCFLYNLYFIKSNHITKYSGAKKFIWLLLD